MPARPAAIAFDVIETLFSLEPLGARMREAGLPEGTLRVFFAQMLRDAFALEASGIYKPFPEIASANLAIVLAGHGLPASKGQADRIMARRKGRGSCWPAPGWSTTSSASFRSTR